LKNQLEISPGELQKKCKIGAPAKGSFAGKKYEAAVKGP
jgi:hypothetical protein